MEQRAIKRSIFYRISLTILLNNHVTFDEISKFGDVIALVILNALLHPVPNLGMDENDPGIVLLATTKENRFAALAAGNELSILAIANVHDKKSAVIVETELEHPITTLEWDLSDSCVVVSDNSGTLHLFTNDGILVFSKKIVSKTGAIISHSFRKSHLTYFIYFMDI